MANIETTVNKHRGALLIAIGGFLVFLYIRHKRQQAAAAAAADAAAAAAAAAAAQDPGTMDQATYDKQFSQPAPAYLGSPFSGYGANAPNFPPPAQGAGPTTPTPPITFPNPNAASGDSTVGAATGGGAPSSGGTGLGPVILGGPGGLGHLQQAGGFRGFDLSSTTPPPGMTLAQWNATRAQLAAGAAYAGAHSTQQAPINPSGNASVTGATYAVPEGSTIAATTGYVSPQVGTGLALGAAGEPGTPGYAGVGYVPLAYR